MEHPFYGSWGYQTTGYFAPTSRYGTPQDLMYLIDTCTSAASACILDWVPSHFPTDEHGLALLRRHAPLRARRPPAGLPPRLEAATSSTTAATRCAASCCRRARFWLDEYHVDGLRVDAVASMLYLDYSRKDGEWIPNEYGGRENLEAIAFLRALNEELYGAHPGRADDRRGVDGVADGLAADVRRRARLRLQVGHGLDARHAAVPAARPGPPRPPPGRADVPRALRVHRELRAAALARRGGARQGLAARQDARRRLAAASPTCGCCSATSGRSRARSCCSWAASSASGTSGTTSAASTGTCSTSRRTPASSAGCADLNRVYRGEPALHERDSDPAGFEWVDARDQASSVLSFLRRGREGGDAARASSTSRPCRATTTASACRRRVAGARCSTATRPSTAAAAWATTAASTPRRCRCTGACARST